MSRKIICTIPYLLLLTLIGFLATKHATGRTYRAELQAKLTSSQQAQDRLASELSFFQTRLGELRTAQLRSEEMQERDLQEEVNTLREQLTEKNRAYKTLQAQVQSAEKEIEQSSKPQTLEEDKATRSEEGGILSAIEKATREERLREQGEIWRRQLQTLPDLVIERAQQSLDPEDQAYLLRAVDLIERIQDFWTRFYNALTPQEHESLRPEQDELSNAFRRLATEYVQWQLEQIGARYQIPPDRIGEFVDAASGLIHDPRRGGNGYFGVGYSIFSFAPEWNAPPFPADLTKKSP